MKYEVIGWTYCGDQDYPPHEPITACVDAAIIKEIRKHGYLFGGDRHEDYCPIFNDGTYVSYSWRGWGRIMALAHDVKGDYAYMFAYMNSLIQRKSRKYPETRFPDAKRIVPRDSLTEIFVMHLADDMFDKVKAGEKTVEIRLFDDKRKLVDIGDYIEFRKSSDESETVRRRVSDLDIRQTFGEMFLNDRYLGDMKWSKTLRFTPKQLGAPDDATESSLVEAMYRFYDKSQEEEYGVIAFTLEKPKHTCHTFFGVWLDEDLYAERLSSCSEGEFKRLFDESLNTDLIEVALRNITDGFKRISDCFKCGVNDDYDADVNVMLRKTLKNLLGKEAMFKEIRERFCVSMTLEIFAVIAESSEEPKQRLSLDSDIKAFLDLSGVKLNVGKRIV